MYYVRQRTKGPEDCRRGSFVYKNGTRGRLEKQPPTGSERQARQIGCGVRGHATNLARPLRVLHERTLLSKLCPGEIWHNRGSRTVHDT